MANLYTVLGSNGSIGRLVVDELRQRGLPIRSVSRQIDPNIKDAYRADLLDLSQTIKALEGSSHAFLTLGLPYKTVVWEKQWPVIMQNVITAAEKNSCKVVFFDNIYMYGPAPLRIPITEEHPQNPPSAKGIVRKQVASMLMDAHQTGKIKATIGRCADFYGPATANGVLNVTVIDRMLAGKRPQWLGDPDRKHTFAYTPDAARALVTLGLDNKSYGQVWHLPVAMPPMTVHEIVDFVNRQLGTALKLSVPPKVLLPIIGTFVPLVKEAAQVMYQSEHDYILSCDKFMRAYPDFHITTYRDGLRSSSR